MNRFERLLYKATFNGNDRVELYDDFEQYLQNDLHIKVIYKKLIDNYTRRGKKPDHPIGKILRECSEKLENGFSLAESLKDWIPDNELGIIDACDKAGSARDGFANAIIICDGITRVRSAVKGITRIGMFLFSLNFAIVAVFCAMLVPAIINTVPLSQWNIMQTMVYYFYLGVMDYWYIFILIFSVLYYLIKISFTHLTGRARRFFDKFLPWKVYRKIVGASFILSVNAMLSAGVAMEEAVISMKTGTRSRWYYERLFALERTISGGEENLGQALDATGYDFPDENAIIKMQTLFETNSYKESLNRFAKKWLEKTISDVERLGSRLHITGLFFSTGTIILLLLVMFPLLASAFFN